MADANISEHGSPANDLNDLFDYDVGLDEIVPANNHANNTKIATAGDSALGLGLDEEVKVTKQRQPVAKLDESRLLSQAGIPKLRQSARRKLKFKGKGHEFSDAARLLNFYQLWLDDLYPRAKFVDGLAMIEKLGHSKRIQVMRREWIDEEKPRPFDSSEPTREMLEGLQILKNATHHSDSNASASTEQEKSGDGDLFIPDHEGTRQTASYPEPDDDDLDDLLREQDEPMADHPSNVAASSSRPPPDNLDDYDAEYEAMKELGL
ncbi:hypothetical protein PENANT_c035G03075 [Penicillium antarcticum]|uniref:Chromosome segregation in meiosis protein n=1 Tax=Penicillium antarcticum TaxID=416450 RepID=A0A1V6PUX1_9EURO|nr:uncharacterized protein N7508_009993 [Penicillium antarcticum]KAJ5295172.1 hypothetical protein N7508_009993 [Penicillium antarcticum]OQD80517.1 hypothetical protein PENANT_c035G03075 [Penicillium antarcticum]